MADEDHGQPEVALEVRQQVQDLRADGHVERGGGLVRDDRVRLERHGARDGDALALAAGQLPRQGAQGALGKADELDELIDAPLLLLRGADLVHQQRVAELVVDDHAGVERGRGVLEHDRDDATDLLAQVRRALRDVRPLEVHVTGRGRLQAAHDVCRGGLAAAGLAHDAHGLARHELDGHALDGVNEVRVQDGARAGPERHRDVVEEDDGLLFRGVAHLPHLLCRRNAGPLEVRKKAVLLEVLVGQLGVLVV